jgi:hypothetical protein
MIDIVSLLFVLSYAIFKGNIGKEWESAKCKPSKNGQAPLCPSCPQMEPDPWTERKPSVLPLLILGRSDGSFEESLEEGASQGVGKGVCVNLSVHGSKPAF